MVTSPNEQKILEWDKQNKQRIKLWERYKFYFLCVLPRKNTDVNEENMTTTRPNIGQREYAQPKLVTTSGTYLKIMYLYRTFNIANHFYLQMLILLLSYKFTIFTSLTCSVEGLN